MAAFLVRVCCPFFFFLQLFFVGGGVEVWVPFGLGSVVSSPSAASVQTDMVETKSDGRC